METKQQREWAEAQKIVVSVDLVDAATKHLKFLAAVDRNRYLYEGPAMEWAIYRYNTYWLPLLAKHSESPISDSPLVVPIDCEWVWHCHRLNPIRYKSDCEKLFGRILGNHNIISSVEGTSKSRSEEIWNTMYPEEPYELDHNRDVKDVINVQGKEFTNYDLASAIKRQVSFYFQVSRSYVSDTLFLEEAAARYKGFLHLIKTNKMKNIRRFCVPTYDIDLMWHSHQIHPVSYCDDLMKILGHVLGHDDTDSDRTKGKKLDVGFSGTTKQWEDTFGLSYWKAGAMYRGAPPTPVTQIPLSFNHEDKIIHTPINFDSMISLSEMKVVEVMLEFVKIKKSPNADKGNLRVSFSKKQPDIHFTTKRTLSILSESGEKQIAHFNCEPTGELLFELLCTNPPSNLQKSRPFKPIGSSSLSLNECLASKSQLYVNKWLPVVPAPGIILSNPILLHVSLSFTPPAPAPQAFRLLHSQSFFEGSCIFPPPMTGEVTRDPDHARVIDIRGNDVLILQMRNYKKEITTSSSGLLKEVLHVTKSGETLTLAEFRGKEWFIKGIHGSMKLRCSSENDGHLFELLGHKTMRLFGGRKLDYEPKQCENKRSEQDFITVVEFSAEYPYGKAVALIDLKHGILKVMDKWMIVTGITLLYILSDTLKGEGCFNAKIHCEGNTLKKATRFEASKSISQRIGYGRVGKCHGACENMTNCGVKCEETINMTSCGGGSCSGGGGGKCGGGKCSANCGNMAKCGGEFVDLAYMALCAGECVDTVDMANCGGGGNCGHTGNCSAGGTCGQALNMANCGGGGNCGHSGNCSGGGTCGQALNMANCGGGGNCGHSGNCSGGGTCGQALNMANCGGGGNCGHSGNCSGGGTCGQALNMANCGGSGNCGHSGNCSGGGTCGQTC